MTINISRLLTLLGFCILTTSVFAQTTSSISVVTPKTKNVKTPLTSVVSKTTPPIIVNDVLDFVIEDDIMKNDGSENGDVESKKINDNNSTNSEELGQIAKIKAIELEEAVNIFPLPATNYFNVTIKDSSIDNFTLINSNGQVVLNEVNSNRQDIIRIETNQLMKGIYFIVLNTSNGRISKSILIQ